MTWTPREVPAPADHFGPAGAAAENAPQTGSDPNHDLTAAAQRGDGEAIRRAIADGANLEHRGGRGGTPLHSAVASASPTDPVRATILGVMALVLATTGCDPVSPPLNQYEGGYRLIEDDQLEVWLGDSCGGVTAIEMVANGDDGEIGTGRFESRRPEGTTISHLVWGQAPEGFEQVAAPPEDWRRAAVLRLRIVTDDLQTSTHIVVDSFTQEAENRAGEWFVQDQGWMTEAAYAALVGEENGILPLCPRFTPRP